MHALTKFLVIVGALLSVFLSAMVIAYATSTDRIAKDYEAEQARRVSAEANLQSGGAQWEGKQAELNQRIAALDSKVSQLTTEGSNKDLEIANLKTERARAEAGRDSLKARVDDLAEIIKTAQLQTAKLTDEAGALRGSELNLRKQVFELETRLADVTSQRDVLEQTRRALIEQLETLKGAGTGGTTVASASGATEPFTPAIRIVGRIEEVRRDASTNKTLVKISVGSNNGVQNNMKFHVVRDNSGFVGSLVVLQTDLSFAVAQVLYTDKLGEPQAGDMVLTRLQ